MKKFITVIDTVFQGRVVGWQEDGKPVLYDTQKEAEIDANAVMADEEPDSVIEVEVTDDAITDPVDGRVYWSKELT
jgi:hypothetical protein